MIKRISVFFLVAGVINLAASCHDEEPTPPPTADNGCYPPEIAAIIINKCATSGCHNTQSKDGAAGLDLSTWEKMFEGTRNGAVTIPFRADQSTLFYFVNTDTLLGIVQQPNMPFSTGSPTPLSQQEVITIRDWINNGAPNCDGFVKYSDNPNRRKFYVANQGCDLVGVHDPDTKMVMRYIDVGNAPTTEAPHMIKISPDGQFWYVCFIDGDYFQKYRTTDDAFVAQVDISQGQQGSWNTFTLSPDGNKAWVVDFDGRVAYVNLQGNMSLAMMYNGPGLFSSPHGSAISSDGNTLYITGSQSDEIYKADVTDPMAPDIEEIIINSSGGNTAKPHEVAISPDGTKYFLTCSNRNEVRVFDVATDAFITAIPTEVEPLEMAFSTTTGKLFVTCHTGNSVTVIDYTNLTVVKNIYVGVWPHGLAVDPVKNVVYVANRNLSNAPGSIPPHHTSVCGGRNGYLTIIDLNTLELVPQFKMELSVDPYSVMVRN